MSRSMPASARRWVAWITLCSAWAPVFCYPASAHAELTVVKQKVDEGILTIYRLTVTPAPEPDPPLRHRLTMREIDLKPGNAATHYLRAFPEFGFETLLKSVAEKYGKEFHDWNRATEVPLGELPLAKARAAAASFDSVVDHFIAPATVRRDCDWGLGVQEMRGPEIVELLLPEFQASRSLSRILALRTRVAIAEGDYDRALEQLRMNYRLAENVGRAPLLVCSLVGLAEAFISDQQVLELMAAKDSPNLYWAIAELPHPIVDVRKAVRFEMSLGLRVFPFLIDAETATHSPEEWARMFAEALSQTGKLTGVATGFSRFSPEFRQAAAAGLAMLQYPDAKRRLIEGGIAADRVALMPVGQVIAVDGHREYRRVADEIEKWMHVPYHTARKWERAYPFDVTGVASVTRGYGYMLAAMLLPAVDAARSAEVRLEWHQRAMSTLR